MTRKRAVKLLMSVTLDGYSRAANDLIRRYRKKHPAATNEQILLDILFRIDGAAICAWDFETMARAMSMYAYLTDQGGTEC